MWAGGVTAVALSALSLGSPAYAASADQPPSAPVLSTSPVTTCSDGVVDTIGDGDVTLDALLSDPDGDPVGVAFSLTATATGAVIATSDGFTNPVSSGSSAKFIVRQAILDDAAHGAITEFSWQARATDFTDTSAWSKACDFKFDPTRPDAPTINDPGGEKVAKPTTFTITPAATGTPAGGYTYQFGGSPPTPVFAVPGQGPQFTLTPRSATNQLTVTALSPGGNVGGSTFIWINSRAADPEVDGDLTGDGVPDLVTVGGVNGLPAGLWLDKGQAKAGDGKVIPVPSNVGVNGTGISTTNLPESYNSTQVITGRFRGNPLQDALVYYPTGNAAGMAAILDGTGDGTAFSANGEHLFSGTFTDSNGDNPLQFANAGNTSGLSPDNSDLIGISGDATMGYYLAYYLDSSGGFSDPPVQLSTPTPEGTMDWQDWTLASAQTASGTGLFLWNKTSRALYLWNDPAFSYDQDAGTGTFAIGTQYLVSSDFNPGPGATLQAADLNGDGTADLWATTAGPTTRAYLVTNLSTAGTATLTAQSAQKLLLPAHTWQLDDAAAAAPADTSGSLNLTATPGVTSFNGGMPPAPNGRSSTDAKFDGHTGTLSTAEPALATNKNFTVAAWVNPSAAGGAVFSQQGVNMSGLSLYVNSTTGKWNVGMAEADVTKAGTDVDSGAVARLGVWSHVVVTYKASTGKLALYIDGALSHRVTHTAAFKATGQFHLGNYLKNDKQTDYFAGQIGHVQIWKHALTGSEVAAQ